MRLAKVHNTWRIHHVSVSHVQDIDEIWFGRTIHRILLFRRLVPLICVCYPALEDNWMTKKIIKTHCGRWKVHQTQIEGVFFFFFFYWVRGRPLVGVFRQFTWVSPKLLFWQQGGHAFAPDPRFISRICRGCSVLSTQESRLWQKPASDQQVFHHHQCPGTISIRKAGTGSQTIKKYHVSWAKRARNFSCSKPKSRNMKSLSQWGKIKRKYQLPTSLFT